MRVTPWFYENGIVVLDQNAGGQIFSVNSCLAQYFRKTPKVAKNRNISLLENFRKKNSVFHDIHSKTRKNHFSSKNHKPPLAGHLNLFSIC